MSELLTNERMNETKKSREKRNIIGMILTHDRKDNLLKFRLRYEVKKFV